MWLLSFSSSPMGSVSVGSWLFIVDSAISMMMSIGTNVKTIVNTNSTVPSSSTASPQDFEKPEPVST